MAGVPVHAAASVTHGQIGNAMHVATVGAVMLATLVCFERVPAPAASPQGISAVAANSGAAASQPGTSDNAALPQAIK